ncbi:riboflavin synthase [Lactobacillus sp. CC-MHH1034]|uniref:riboflavin synthase n=1 Tax=Agrilactobacillus fermenti TaxID=2586909 RepID=UPI001E45F49C|nr:riboflavin synthase [Agrilactobacillus fermenti]MCD2256364.1 riboflavin synthase [Agrilactobacillus fermenti]
MFTGIIQTIGRVTSLEKTKETAKIRLKTAYIKTWHSKVGDSIAVNGVCLTITAIQEDYFTVDVMPETMRRTNFNHLQIGAKVNLEPALQASARLDGHFVLGHVDTITVLVKRQVDQNAVVLTFALPMDYQRQIVVKGSIAVAGVSLTITNVTSTTFSVGLIPHTLIKTTLGDLQIGNQVNIETDILGKYIFTCKGV